MSSETKATTTKPIVVSSNATSPPVVVSFHHVLMEADGKKKRILDGRLKRDYLARRYRAFQEAKSNSTTTATVIKAESTNNNGNNNNNNNNKDEEFWSGASNTERSLISCCHDDDDNSDEVPGALKRNKIITFVGKMSLLCHANERPLVIAILERTQEADEIDLDYWNTTQSQLYPVNNESRFINKKRKTNNSSSESDEEEDEESNNEEDDDEHHHDVVQCMSPKEVHAQKKIDIPRLQLFLQAGGLHILSRWLVEASTPIIVINNTSNNKSFSNNKNKSERKTASPTTGPILLPLLLLLQKLPFNINAIKQSRINKKIKTLSKQLQVIVDDETDEIELLNKKDPVGGGLSVMKVQHAVNELMKIWEEKSKEDNTETTGDLADPFASLKSKLAQRLKDLQKFDDISDEQSSSSSSSADIMPDWLKRVHLIRKESMSKSKKSETTTTKTSSISHREMTLQLAKKERENERSALMKQDLEKAQRERRELLRKLRNLKQNDNNNKSNHNTASAVATTTGRSVQWKDGMGRTSKMRNRDLLEEVFVFIKDKDIIIKSEQDDEDDNLLLASTDDESTTTTPSDNNNNNSNNTDESSITKTEDYTML